MVEGADMVEIEEFELKQPYEIPKSDITKSRSKQFNLISNLDDGNTYVLRNKWYEFNFEEAVYSYKIIFKSKDKTIKGLEIVVFDQFKNEKKFTLSHESGNHISINTQMIISGFKIKAPFKVSLNKMTLQSIRIIGYQESYFEIIEDAVDKYLDINEELSSQSKKIESRTVEVDAYVSKKEKEIVIFEAEIKELEVEFKDLGDEVTSATKTRDSLVLEALDVNTKLETSIKNVKSNENNIEQLTAQSKIINTEIISNENTLKKLVNNNNLFAYEVEDYIKQGNRNIKTYMFLSFVPWILITYVSWYLFNGAVELTKIDNINDVEILNLILSRLPFTLIAGAIIVVSYELSKIFATKIIEINTQKLRFSEIGIIAKDTSYASSDGLDIIDSELFELRTKLKMDLLRHHLKKLDPEIYEYEINPSIWNKYSSVIKRGFSRKVQKGKDQENTDVK